MSPLGKIAGALIGLLFGGPLGAIWGAVAGHFIVDKVEHDSATLRGLEKVKTALRAKTNKKLGEWLDKRDLNVAGKLFGAVIGGWLFGFVGLVWGFLFGHVLVDHKGSTTEMLRDLTDKYWQKHWGKIAGATTGAVLAGPLGTLWGLIGGHLVDLKRNTGELRPPYGLDIFLNRSREWADNPFQSAARSSEARHVTFVQTMAALSAKLAKVDGTVSRKEVNAFKAVFDIPQDEFTKIANAFDNAKKTAKGYEPYARQLKMLIENQPAVISEVMEALFSIAAADAQISNSEKDFLWDVSRILGQSSKDYERLRYEFSRPSQRDGYNKNYSKTNKDNDQSRTQTPGTNEKVHNPYEILELTRGASDAEVKTARHRLIRENHPDALMAKGMSQAYIDLATKRMAEINAAYDQIATDRGMRR